MPTNNTYIQHLNAEEPEFDRVYLEHYAALHHYAYTLLEDSAQADEMVQDVFLKIWLHRENLNLEQSFKSYLFTIARNQAFNLLNKAANDVLLKEEVFYTSEKSYAQGDYSIREEDCKKLKKQAINQLPPKRKRIFKMSRKEGKTYEEISQELGISVNTVKNQMSKALDSMRDFFQVHDGFT